MDKATLFEALKKMVRLYASSGFTVKFNVGRQWVWAVERRPTFHWCCLVTKTSTITTNPNGPITTIQKKTTLMTKKISTTTNKTMNSTIPKNPNGLITMKDMVINTKYTMERTMTAMNQNTMRTKLYKVIPEYSNWWHWW